MTHGIFSRSSGMTWRAWLAAAGVVGLGLSASAGAAEALDLKPFPKPEATQTRYVVELPRQAVEGDYQVQLIVGKTMPVDCNRQFMMGNLEEEVAQGWGYPYYVLKDVKGPASTLMACPEESKREGFVSVQGQGFTVAYNSRLPLVVYVPQGYQLRYRLWQASDETWEVSPSH